MNPPSQKIIIHIQIELEISLFYKNISSLLP